MLSKKHYLTINAETLIDITVIAYIKNLLTSKKMGRPTDNPKPNKLNVRVDDETLNKVAVYPEQDKRHFPLA